MSITQIIEIDIIKVEVNDECRIDVTSARKTVDLSPAEAQQLAAELTVAAADALALLAEQDVQRALRDRENGLIAADRVAS
jgi:uncharacterized lipoprotein NlpE involved in copper resistance